MHYVGTYKFMLKIRNEELRNVVQDVQNPEYLLYMILDQALYNILYF